ncbi:MAG: FmdB family transcriptional regulator [Desulfatitalea sp. BRH_c12]|nr:MAG: FmdB family transcriptional regulator [Desulfatitalea sp. BRH_c12]
MPIYEYQCDQCGRVEEVLQKITEEPLTKCNHCSGKLNKLVSQSAFHLKGTGWYVTDYAGKTKNQNKDSAASSTPNSADSGDTKPAVTNKTSSED